MVTLSRPTEEFAAEATPAGAAADPTTAVEEEKQKEKEEEEVTDKGGKGSKETNGSKEASRGIAKAVKHNGVAPHAKAKLEESSFYTRFDSKPYHDYENSLMRVRKQQRCRNLVFELF